MPHRPKDHFSERTLKTAEHAQKAAVWSRPGRAAVRLVTGSSSPLYRQLQWRSIRNERGLWMHPAEVAGDPTASLLPRNWQMAAIIATPHDALQDLIGINSRGAKPEPAIAYATKKNINVGTLPVAHETLFQQEGSEALIAMRLGRGPLRAALGVWLPDQQAFIITPETRVAEPKIDLPKLAARFPNITLV
jgi:hypothetical protein